MDKNTQKENLLLIAITAIISLVYFFLLNTLNINVLGNLNLVILAIVASMLFSQLRIKTSWKMVTVLIGICGLLLLFSDSFLEKPVGSSSLVVYSVVQVFIYAVTFFFYIKHQFINKNISRTSRWLLIITSPIVVFVGSLFAYIVLGFLIYHITSLFM